VLLCWLSLLLVRIAEVNTKQTWTQLRSELEDMHLIEYESTDGKVFQRTEITEAQKRILFLLEIPESARILIFPFRRGQKCRHTANYPQAPQVLGPQGFEALLVPADCEPESFSFDGIYPLSARYSLGSKNDPALLESLILGPVNFQTTVSVTVIEL